MHASKKYKIAIVCRFNTTWAAGQYYVENLLLALTRLSESVEITVLYGPEKPQWNAEPLRITRFDYRDIDPRYSIFEKLVNRACKLVFGKISIEKRIRGKDYDAIFPVGRTCEYPFNLAQNLVFWIPDFQDNHYPENFTSDELSKRRIERQKIADSDAFVVLSSQSALKDFLQFFPDQRCKSFVLPFRVYHHIETADEKSVLAKYAVKPQQYFICANQFWRHKNHQIIVKAVELLVKTNPESDFKVLFTGRESGFANDGAAKEAKAMVDDRKLNDYIHFLGFIDRSEQLLLMKNSVAVLQPSFFEGWNTSIEDAYALGVPVVASNISVHCEQVQDSKALVDPNSVDHWASAMLMALNSELANPSDYTIFQKQFEHNLMHLIEKVSHE